MNKALIRVAACDLHDGAFSWRVWLGLAWKDIQMRYSRSLLGPLWLTIGMVVWAIGIGMVWSTLFHVKLEGYMPYLTAGILAWQLYSQSLVEATMIFVTSKAILDSIDLPTSLQVFRFACRQLFVYLHGLPAFLLVALVFHVDVNFNTLLFIPGLALAMLNILWTAMFLGVLGARYRDVQQIIANAIMLLFFVTPIFWERSFLQNKTIIADANPIFHLVNLIRAPLLGEVPPWESYAVAIGLAIVGWTFTFLFFARFRIRLHYWI